MADIPNLNEGVQAPQSNRVSINPSNITGVSLTRKINDLLDGGFLKGVRLVFTQGKVEVEGSSQIVDGAPQWVTFSAAHAVAEMARATHVTQNFKADEARNEFINRYEKRFNIDVPENISNVLTPVGGTTAVSVEAAIRLIPVKVRNIYKLPNDLFLLMYPTGYDITADTPSAISEATAREQLAQRVRPQRGGRGRGQRGGR